MNRVALITGASGGLGYEFCKLFAGDGYDLAIASRSKEKLLEVKEEIEREYRVKVTIFPLDISEEGSAQKLFNLLKAARIKINALVNNAGFGNHDSFLDSDLGSEKQLLQLNITTLTELTKLLLSDIIRTRGKILNVASTAAFQPGPFMATYYASKAYVYSFSMALSEELKNTGVTVTTLCPGPTRTGFQARAGMEKALLFRFYMMKAPKVAKEGYKGMREGKRLVIPGVLNKLGFWLVKFVPGNLLLRSVGRFNS